MPLRALVTGDEGFLGRHFAQALVERGYELYVYDIKRGFADDCRTLFRLRDEGYRGVFDLVIHCAAVVGGREVIDNDPLETAVNIELDTAMFRWAAFAQPRHVVYVSSSAVYPVFKQGSDGLLREDEGGPGCTGEPDQTYGWTKLLGEHLAAQVRQHGVSVTIIRPFSGYGVDQDETYPFRAFIERARRRDDPFEIWGTGEQVRDFVHVDDVVSATLTAVTAGVSGPLNICTGVPTSFNQLAGLVCRAAGYSPKFLWRGDKPQGVRYRVGSTKQLEQVYRPNISLSEGVWKALQ